MRRSGFLLTALAVGALACAPSLAFARAGSGASMGSRGSFTYSAPPATNTAPGGGSLMQRSLTPQSPSPSYGTPGYGAPAYGGGYGHSPFMSGLMGGLIGAGIGGLLFGHGLFGGISGIGGFLGFLLQIFLVVWLARMAFRFFTRQPAMAGPGIFARTMGAMGGGMGAQRAMPDGRPAVGAVTIGPADFQQFDQSLQAIQAAWTARDLPRMQSLATPEMVSFFSDQLSEQASRGVHNSVTNVKLEQGDLAQSWAEAGREYATVAMRFSMIDITTDGAGRIVEGDPRSRAMATELWTFVRAPGGRWILSAIQQAR